MLSRKNLINAALFAVATIKRADATMSPRQKWAIDMPSDAERTNPYEIVSEFWGDQLDQELLRRIVNAPQSHLDEFRDYYYQGSDLSRLPALSLGSLRPIIRSNPIDVVSSY